MLLHEDLARLRVNDAIRTGLESQRAHRALESPDGASDTDQPVAIAHLSAPQIGLQSLRWFRNLFQAAKRIAGIT